MDAKEEARVVVRESGPSDHEALLALMDEFNALMADLDPARVLTYPAGAAKFFVDRMIDHASRDRGKVYVAECEGAVLGFIGGYVAPSSDVDLFNGALPEVGEIIEFYVKEAYRGRGIGRMLMDAMESHLRAEGCTRISLIVDAFNPAAREFYRKSGYHERDIKMLKIFS